jgi:hypothetical protein
MDLQLLNRFAYDIGHQSCHLHKTKSTFDAAVEIHSNHKNGAKNCSFT